MGAFPIRGIAAAAILALATVATPAPAAEDTVARIQEGLAERGYYTGSVDGHMGPNTRRAIRDFQFDMGLSVDGTPDRDLLQHLEGASSVVTAGARTGESTRAAQQALAALGYYNGPIDGMAGPRTSRAATAFQRDFGLRSDGRVDKRLLHHIHEALEGGRGHGHVVRRMQVMLYDLGYYKGRIDGQTGPQTRRAMDAFAEDAGLNAPDAITLEFLTALQRTPDRVETAAGRE